jgi:hypothetical protein
MPFDRPRTWQLLFAGPVPAGAELAQFPDRLSVTTIGHHGRRPEYGPRGWRPARNNPAVPCALPCLCFLILDIVAQSSKIEGPAPPDLCARKFSTLSEIANGSLCHAEDSGRFSYRHAFSAKCKPLAPHSVASVSSQFRPGQPARWIAPSARAIGVHFPPFGGVISRQH